MGSKLGEPMQRKILTHGIIVPASKSRFPMWLVIVDDDHY